MLRGPAGTLRWPRVTRPAPAPLPLSGSAPRGWGSVRPAPGDSPGATDRVAQPRAPTRGRSPALGGPIPGEGPVVGPSVPGVPILGGGVPSWGEPLPTGVPYPGGAHPEAPSSGRSLSRRIPSHAGGAAPAGPTPAKPQPGGGVTSWGDLLPRGMSCPGESHPEVTKSHPGGGHLPGVPILGVCPSQRLHPEDPRCGHPGLGTSPGVGTPQKPPGRGRGRGRQWAVPAGSGRGHASARSLPPCTRR